MPDPVLILGLGFTTQRLARRLRQRDAAVSAAVRHPERFGEFAALGVELHELSDPGLPRNAILIHSVPPLAEPEQSAIRAIVRGVNPRRILYISSTGVYGEQTHVTEDTPAEPHDETGRKRVNEESWILSLGVPALILRCAAIYGPGRGVHVRLRENKTPRGAGGVVSRIHVDDLAALLEAGIDSQVEGAWPVADNQPAPSDEVAAWCAKTMGLSLPANSAGSYPVAGRSVDGRKIRELLGAGLRYPSYQTGIAASLAEEAAETVRSASSASTSSDTSTLPTPSA